MEVVDIKKILAPNLLIHICTSTPLEQALRGLFWLVKLQVAFSLFWFWLNNQKRSKRSMGTPCDLYFVMIFVEQSEASLGTLCGLCFVTIFFNPNWHEAGHFPPLVLFWSDFWQLNFIKISFLEVKIDTLPSWLSLIKNAPRWL